MGLVITGMHRSGTSAVARIVDGIGLAIAAPDSAGVVMPAGPDNPRGFFERLDVMQLNDAWLSELGGSWWAPPATSESTWVDLDRERLDRERRLLGLFDVDAPAWFVKDPRISLLLPLWDRLALQELPVILAIRDPREVVSSLRLRDGMTPTRALALWYTYLSQALTQSSDRPVLVIDYGQLVEAPAASCAAIARFARETTGSGPSRLSPEELGSLVDPRLQRNRQAGVRGLHELDLAAALETYRELAKFHAQDLDRPPAAPMPPVWVDAVLAEAREANTLRERLDAADRELRSTLDEVIALRSRPEPGEGLGAELAARELELGDARMRADGLVAELAARELELGDARLRAEGLVAELAARELDLAEALSQRDLLAEDIDRIREAVEQSQREAALELAESRSQRDLLAEQLAGALAEADLLRAEAKQALDDASLEIERGLVSRRRAVHERDLLARSHEQVLEEHRRQLAERDRSLAWLRKELEQSRALAVELAATRTSVGAQLGSAQAGLERAKEGLRSLSEALEQARAARVRAEGAQMRLAGELEAVVMERDSAVSESAVLAEELSRLRMSRAFRLGRTLTAPIRALRSQGRTGPDPQELALILRSGFFDAQWYAQESPDVVAAGLDPFTHYVHQGWRELRSPGPNFDAAWYAAHHEVPDGVNPLVHYLRNRE